MTISARNWAWTLTLIADDVGEWRNLTAGEKATLLCLAELENGQQGYAFPSQELLAHRTCQNQRTVRRHLRSFTAAHLIKVQKRRPRDGSWERSVYFLNVPDGFRIGDPGWMNQPQEGVMSFGRAAQAK